MVGVVIDGEDVMQDALIKAVEARPQPAHPKPAGLAVSDRAQRGADFLRCRHRREPLRSGEEMEMIAKQLDAITSPPGLSCRTPIRRGLPPSSKPSMRATSTPFGR
jgi:RNA polymerase sigma-70 factor (ECF subfamily)